MKQISYLLFGIGLTAALMATGCDKAQPTVDGTGTGTETMASTTIVQPTTDDELAQDTALNNPATVYCLQEGGKFNMRKNLTGTTEGLCTLPDNVTCEVWAFYKGDCPVGRKHEAETATSTDAQVPASEGIEKAMTSTALDTTPLEEEAPEKTQDGRKPSPATPHQETAVTDKTDRLTLSAQAGDTGEITVSWKTNGLEAQDGFIVMLSGNKDLTYPAKYSHVLQNPQSRSFTWTDLVTDRTYYFRACVADATECGTYSDVVSTTAP